MRKEKPSMKKEKQILGVRKVNANDPKDLGIITFGKSRPDKTKYVLIDINYDDKAGKELFKAGLECLQHDKEAVIEYVIKKALKYTAEFGKAKCKK